MIEIIHKIKGYLGYGVKCEYLWTAYDNKYITNSGIAILDDILFDKGEGNYKYIYIKPILRPLESLTDEEIIKFLSFYGYDEFTLNDFQRNIKKLNRVRNENLKNIIKENLRADVKEYLNSIHIDYQDLIGQGFAVELNNKGE